MKTGKKALFAVAPLLLVGVCGEVGARVVGAPDCEAIVPQATGWETMVGDPRTLWKLEPDRVFESQHGTSTTNSVGLRSALLPSDTKAAGELRVMVTGDSSVFGWGQPDGQTYAEQLESLLDKMIPKHTVKVVNLGVPGYSTVQTLRLLEDVGWSYEPDLLVVHNIFSDCNIDAFQDETALALADPDGTPVRRALHGSRMYCAAYMPWARYTANLNQQPNRVLMPGMPTGANQATTLEKVDTVIDLSRVPLDDYLDNLDEIRTEAAGHGAKMMLAPLAQEWDVGVWTAPMAQPTEGQVLPWHPYREAQAEWAEERQISRVYLPDAFAATTIDPNRLFSDHMHPSVEGGGVMARAVAREILAHPELLGLEAADLQEPPELQEPEGGGKGGKGSRGGPGARGGPGGPGGQGAQRGPQGARPPGQPPGGGGPEQHGPGRGPGDR